MSEQLNARNINVLADEQQKTKDRADRQEEGLGKLSQTIGMMQKKIQQLEQRVIVLELSGKGSGPTK